MKKRAVAESQRLVFLFGVPEKSMEFLGAIVWSDYVFFSEIPQLNLTRIVSFPMRSMSRHGIEMRFFDDREASNPFPGRQMAQISPVQELISRS
jgi:hypothetical protein